MPKRKTHHLTKASIHSTIKSMAEDIKAVIVSPNRTPLKIAAVILTIVVLGIILWRTIYFSKSPTPSPTPVSQASAFSKFSNNLATCSITKGENPLVESVSIQPDTVQVDFKGKITDLSTDPIRNSHIIKLTSLDGKQTYPFNIREQKGLFFNATGESLGSALKTNQILRISFSCDKKNNLFKFTRVLTISEPPVATKSSTPIKK